jgi:hypothetical protein
MVKMVSVIIIAFEVTGIEFSEFSLCTYYETRGHKKLFLGLEQFDVN